MRASIRIECRSPQEWPDAGRYPGARFAAELRSLKGKAVKYAGLFVLPAGFFLSVAALILFPSPAPRTAFVVCGLAVEGLGLAVAVRGHMEARGERKP